MARILVIDDEGQVRTMLRQMLERAGYEVVEAPDGVVAARQYREDPTDLIITDVLMPEKDGLETILELRREFGDVKIIAISGGGVTGRLDLLPAARHLGAVYTFRKPFDRCEFLSAVERVLSADANGEAPS